MMHVSSPSPSRLTAQRQAEIAAILARDGQVVAGDLATGFGVSEDTIRRDLREMAADGLCRRVYGGAIPAAPDDGPLSRRVAQGAARKTALAEALVCTIAPGSCLFLDAGSTNLAVAEALSSGAGLTVVTNAPAVASVLAGRGGFDIILIGGRLDPASGACLGPQTLRDLDRFRFSALVLGACGVDAEAGLTAHVFEEAELKAAAAERSEAILVAATNEKLGTAAAFRIVPASRIARLVVEADCAPAQRSAFAARGIPVASAQAPPPAAGSGLSRRRRAAAASPSPRTSAAPRPETPT